MAFKYVGELYVLQYCCNIRYNLAVLDFLPCSKR